MYNLSLDFEWKSVETIENIEVYRYPQPLDKRMSKAYQNAAVYRWRIYRPNTESKIVYIGEAGNLKRRISGYLKPGSSQRTNYRMKALFEQYVQDGFLIELDLLQIKILTVNEIEYHQDSLSSKNIRVLLENLIILDHKNNGYEILNANV